MFISVLNSRNELRGPESGETVGKIDSMYCLLTKKNGNNGFQFRLKSEKSIQSVRKSVMLIT